MHEAADIASSIPAIVILSMWWAFLSTLEMLLHPGDVPDTDSRRTAAPQPEAEAAAAAQDERLADLRAVEPGFDPGAFLRGACGVYETVLDAYASGDSAALEPLLSPEVFAAFGAACAERQARGETLELALVGIDKAEILDVDVLSDRAEVTVLFRTQFVGVVRTDTGEVASGSPVAIQTAADRWTFARPLPGRRADWVIVATDVE